MNKITTNFRYLKNYCSFINTLVDLVCYILFVSETETVLTLPALLYSHKYTTYLRSVLFPQGNCLILLRPFASIHFSAGCVCKVHNRVPK